MRAKFFGGDGKGGTPVPIPNTEVKSFSADGTAWVAAWESRSPPITSFTFSLILKLTSMSFILNLIY